MTRFLNVNELCKDFGFMWMIVDLHRRKNRKIFNETIQKTIQDSCCTEFQNFLVGELPQFYEKINKMYSLDLSAFRYSFIGT